MGIAMRGSRHGPWLQYVPMTTEITNINQFPSNEEQIEQERRYRIEERLGIMCGTNVPTDEQLAIAIREADEWVLEYVKSLP
jgi:hypothetical protein